jgi:hypothetical protein
VLNTRPRAINGVGTIAGFVETLDAVRHGFIAKVGRVQIIDADDTGTTVLEGMNDNEFAAGQVADAEGNPHSFTSTTPRVNSGRSTSATAPRSSRRGA